MYHYSRFVHFSGYDGIHFSSKILINFQSDITCTMYKLMYCNINCVWVLDRIKMGAAAELGLVTSPEEFIPRAGAVHLNTHVFGNSVNFAEVCSTVHVHVFDISRTSID